MSSNDSQVPWGDEQWARVNQVVQEEAARARVAASFLPLIGPLPPDTDFVRAEKFTYGGDYLSISDATTIQLPTLQVKVSLRGAQLADPDLTSVLAVFRRASNILARLEDALIFNGREPNQPLPHGAPQAGGQITGNEPVPGLLNADDPQQPVQAQGRVLVEAVSTAIGQLEHNGHFGPFAVVLGQRLFVAAETPEPNSMVLPQDRIVPLLGGGSLLRSTTLPEDRGVIVALGGAPVELVVATDVTVGFLQITTDPNYIFRVYEKLVLRVKERSAIVALVPGAQRRG